VGQRQTLSVQSSLSVGQIRPRVGFITHTGD